MIYIGIEYMLYKCTVQYAPAVRTSYNLLLFTSPQVLVHNHYVSYLDISDLKLAVLASFPFLDYIIDHRMRARKGRFVLVYLCICVALREVTALTP